MHNVLYYKKKCILVGIITDELSLVSLEELAELAKTLSLDISETITQKIKFINGGTYIGSGKMDELKVIVEKHKPDYVIFDTDLSPIQQRNIEKELNATVMDRTFLILEIFASRAQTKEGKIQVELASLSYLQTRLMGHGVEMSRLGGGIGTRGPGEQKLEGDRRRIKTTIAQLKKELASLEQSRKTNSKLRRENRIPHIAIVGYTNAGKSTLINLLTGSDVFIEDKLFATLDPTTRKLVLPNGSLTLITDTVGFVRNLPHQLVKAFKSTFEGIRDADLILHIINLGDKNFPHQSDTVFSVLKDLDLSHIPVLNVYNKEDISIADKTTFLKFKKVLPFVSTSALMNTNIDKLCLKIQEILESKWFIIDLDLVKLEPSKVKELMKYGKIITSENQNENTVSMKFQKEFEGVVKKIIS